LIITAFAGASSKTDGISKAIRLSHGSLWYRNETDAISYAKWNSRVKGCKIAILDERDEVVRTEECSAGDFVF
jgi:hypothetical protein